MSDSCWLAAAVAGRASRLRAELAQAGRIQRETLAALASAQARTAFGRAHGLDTIADLDEWRRRVPIQSAESLAPWVARAAAGEADVLFPGRAIAIEQTGGSTAGTRRIAYGAASLAEFRQAALPWLDDLFQCQPALVAQPSYWAISPVGRAAAEPAGPTGQAGSPSAAERAIPLGLDDAAYLGESAGAGLLGSLCVPPAVGAIADHRLWQRLTLVHLLCCRDLGLVSVWSPTFLGELLRALDDDRDLLIAAVREGPGVLADLPGGLPTTRPADPLAAALRWTASPARADEIAAAWQAGPGRDRAEPARLWPRLGLVSCWADASSAAAANRLARLLPQARLQPKGLLATEGAVTLPLSPFPAPVLAIRSGFFEFVDDAGTIRTGDELRPGERLSVLLTNASGLCRYRLGDTVECVGMAGQAPMLRFVGRGGRTTDLVGEKLDEAFVADCLARLPAAAWPVDPGTAVAVLVAEPRDEPHAGPVASPRTAVRPGYRLLVETAHPGDEGDPRAAAALIAQLDLGLSRNPQYAYARRLGQLAPPAFASVPDLTRRWIAARLAAGQTLGDIKLPALAAADDFGATLAADPPSR